MAEAGKGARIEVTGVGDRVDKMALTLLLESKRKMGRALGVVDVDFNTDRKAALVTLVNDEDAEHALTVGSVSLEGKLLRFTTPDANLWRKSTVCVNNIPPHITKEEISLRFENKKTWGRELDVQHVTFDKERQTTYITYVEERDATLVIETGIKSLFGVAIEVEGPVFPAVLDTDKDDCWDVRKGVYEEYDEKQRKTSVDVEESDFPKVPNNLTIEKPDSDLSTAAIEANSDDRKARTKIDREVVPNLVSNAKENGLHAFTNNEENETNSWTNENVYKSRDEWMEMPEIFLSVEAIVNPRILPVEYSNRVEWKYNLRRQFKSLEISEQNECWLLMGPWHEVEEARSCLKLWYSQWSQVQQSNKPNGRVSKNGATGNSASANCGVSTNNNGGSLKDKFRFAGQSLSDTEEGEVKENGTEDVEMKEIRNEFASVDLKTMDKKYKPDGAMIGETDVKDTACTRKNDKTDTRTPDASRSTRLQIKTVLQNGSTNRQVPLGTSRDSPWLSCTMHNRTDVYLYLGDITKLSVEAIVNAANERLQHGGGVAGAISKAAGPWFQRKSSEYVRKNGSVPLSGVAVCKSGSSLPYKYILNAVGPNWNQFRNKEDCKQALLCTFYNSFKCANENCRVTSMAVPPISSGIYMVPMKVVAQALFDALVEFDANRPQDSTLKEIHIVDVNSNNMEVLKTILYCRFRQLSDDK